MASMVRFYHAFLPPCDLRPLEKLDQGSSRCVLYSVPVPPATQDQDASQSDVSAVVQTHATSSELLRPAPELSGSRRSKRLRTSGASQGAAPTQLLPSWEPTASHQSSLNTTFSLSGQTRPSDSLTNLPRWTLPLSKLTPLASLVQDAGRATRLRARRSLSESDSRRNVSLVCCVMSVESPVEFQKRNQGGRGRSRDGGWATGWRATWRVSCPTNEGRHESASDPVSCDVLLWDACARDWGGIVRKGDVILLQDVSFSAATGTQGPRITLSPSGGSVPEPIVLYRTLPRYATNKSDYVYQSDAARVAESPNRGEMSSEDRAFRPHLRLSDPGLRLVAKMAEWCAQWVGGEPPVV